MQARATAVAKSTAANAVAPPPRLFHQLFRELLVLHIVQDLAQSRAEQS